MGWLDLIAGIVSTVAHGRDNGDDREIDYSDLSGYESESEEYDYGECDCTSCGASMSMHLEGNVFVCAKCGYAELKDVVYYGSSDDEDDDDDYDEYYDEDDD